MKLYTEEQVIKAIQLSRTFAVHMKTEDIVILVADKLTPIELPSDEEIDEECRKLPFEKHVDDGQYNDGQMAGFELGAYWMRQQILNQNN